MNEVERSFLSLPQSPYWLCYLGTWAWEVPMEIKHFCVPIMDTVSCNVNMQQTAQGKGYIWGGGGDIQPVITLYWYTALLIAISNVLTSAPQLPRDCHKLVTRQGVLIERWICWALYILYEHINVTDPHTLYWAHTHSHLCLHWILLGNGFQQWRASCFRAYAVAGWLPSQLMEATNWPLNTDVGNWASSAKVTLRPMVGQSICLGVELVTV
jgi:hypothetical protein